MAAEGSQLFASEFAASEPKGPFFVDTARCRCALQEKLSEAAWRCMGNATVNVYAGDSGKWFYALNQDNSSSFKDPPYSNSNPPDTNAQYMIFNNKFELITKNKPFAAQDLSCTGNNDTLLSGQVYLAIAAVDSGDVPCWQPGTIPLVIQTPMDWAAHGCNLGFLCQNNSNTSPPTYCPPLPEIQKARLLGAVTPPMGRTEPVLCSEGSYCPPSGRLQIHCPAGYYCSRGAYQPTICSFSATCPAGSYVNRPLLPLALLIMVDVLLIVATSVTITLWKRQRSDQKRRHRVKYNGPMLPLSRNPRSQHYHNLRDEEAHIVSSSPDIGDANIGYLAAVEDRSAFSEDTSDPNQNEKASPDMLQFVHSLSRFTPATTYGLSFKFEDLTFQPKNSSKPILSGVTGEIRSGTLWGVMGASGAGKSTFMNVLMGSQSHTGGTTRVNGSLGAISKYKKIIGYVPQDDIVLPELTVRENVLYSARIRLPSDWKEKQIQTHVDVLLKCLNLFHVKDSLVGSTAAPVVSGGERKRVSIGIELAAAPMALFLDEPTSGLDSTSASSIIMTLKALSRIGITVVTIIHQPRHEIFEALDSILLLGEGRTLYLGSQKDVQPYFEKCGYTFPNNHGNPADVIMDIIAGHGSMYNISEETSVLPTFTGHSRDIPANIESLQSPISSSTADAAELRKTIQMRGAPFLRQIYFCLCRALLQQYRRKSSFFSEIGVAALAGLLIGLAELGQDGINFRGIYKHPYEILSSSTDFASIPEMSLLVALSIGLTASSPGVRVFGEEKLIYLREASSGHNRFAYYIGKVLSTIPRMFLANLHFTVFFILLATPKISWGAAFIANLLYFYCIYGLASCVSMITRREDGPLIATMAGLVTGIISGVTPTLRVVKGWHLVWLWRASPGTWLAEGYFTKNVVPYDYLYQIDLAAQSTGYSLNKFGLDCAMLFAFGSLYRVLAFIALRVFNRRVARGRR